MLSAPAGLEEVIKYADFKSEMSLEQLDDESTLEDEPDREDLDDLISGNITSNQSQIVILSTGRRMKLTKSNKGKECGKDYLNSIL